MTSFKVSSLSANHKSWPHWNHVLKIPGGRQSCSKLHVCQSCSKVCCQNRIIIIYFLNVSKPTHSSVYRVPLLNGVFTKGTSTLQSLEDKAQQPSIYGFLRAGAAACQGQEAVQLDYEQRTFISSQGSLHTSDHHLTVQTDHTLPSTCRLIRIHVADQRFKSSGDAEFPHG